MTPRIITVIGSLNTDLVTIANRVPLGGETLTASSFFTGLGGKGANQAVACARLSRPDPSTVLQSTDTQNLVVKMVGAVGGDEFGPRIISSMTSGGIDMSSVVKKEGYTTGVAVIIVEESSGENRILLNPGANHSLIPEDFVEISSLGAPLPDIIILQLEIPLSTVLQIIKTARKAGIDVVLNPAPAILLPNEAYQDLAHLILNESEAAILTGRSVQDVMQIDFDWVVVVKEFLAKGVRNITVTLGDRGAVFGCKSTTAKIIVEHVPAVKVDKVVDTTAAGDTFVGAYALGVVKGENDFLKITKYACMAAAQTIQKKGAQESIPWSNEIELLEK